jgi:hypothetical protein
MEIYLMLPLEYGLYTGGLLLSAEAGTVDFTVEPLERLLLQRNA